MQPLNLNHQQEVNQLLANVNELLCSPTTTSSDCCCKVSDLKMQVLQLRNDLLILGYGNFLRKLRQYRSNYESLKCKICSSASADSVCTFGRQLYINQIENVDYSIDSNNFTINSITTTMGSVLSWFNITAYNSETNASITVSPSSIAEIDISYLGSLQRLVVTFVCYDGFDDLIFSVYIMSSGQGVVAISIPSVAEGSGYPISSNYHLLEDANPQVFGVSTTYIGYTSTKTTPMSSGSTADVIYNDLSHVGYYDIDAVYNCSLGANFGNIVLHARIALRQTCLTQNTQCPNVTSLFSFDSGLSSYNSGTDTATFIFHDGSDYQGQPIDYITFEELVNGIYITSTAPNDYGSIIISGTLITISIINYTSWDLGSNWDVVLNTTLKTCDSASGYNLEIRTEDLPQPPIT